MTVMNLQHRHRDLAHAAPLLGASMVILALAAGSSPAAPPRAGLDAVRSWGYQLQQIDPATIAASPYDLVVIDYARDGTQEFAFDRATVTAMQRKPDGERRIVLAYLSIGEAEDYRFYWHHDWMSSPPGWLLAENPDWPGNYAVRYWDPQWQAMIFGGPGSYLDTIISAGFDGVYLDRIDAFDVADAEVPRADRLRRMAEFVSALAGYGRSKVPGFLIVGQNGEELLADRSYASVIDGLGKEDLFFGLDGDGVPNSNAELRASLTPIQRFQASGKPVFLVEYVDTPDALALARERAAALGVPLFIGDRELDDVQSR